MVNLSEFKVNHYPDGHKHIVSNLDLHGDDTLSVSIRSFDDLFLVAQVKAIHPELKTLRVLYMLASRCDRRFSPGEAIDIEIVTGFIRGLGFEQVCVIKPHSSKTMECLGTYAYTQDYTLELLEMVRKDIGWQAFPVFIAPDKGAKAWMDVSLKPMLYGEKKRDPTTGAVIGVQIIGLEKWTTSDRFVIVDDLCDGGATFTTIAREIKSLVPTARVYLVVTHAILSKGVKPFEGLIDRIYCTDSFAKFNDPLIKQLEIS